MLDSLPTDVIAHLARVLASDPRRRVRDVVSLVLVSKNLYNVLTSVDGFWFYWSRVLFRRCEEVNSLQPRFRERMSPTKYRHVPRRPDRSAEESSAPGAGWRYFSKRMARRAALHYAMRRTLLVHRGTAMMPGEGPQELLQLERRLGVPLPDELWDLWRVYGGQQPHFLSGIFEGARMLTIAEVIAQGIIRTTTIAGPWGRDELCHLSPQTLFVDGRRSHSDVCCEDDANLHQHHNCKFDHAKETTCEEGVVPLIPLSDALRGGRQYAVGPDGRIWLVSNFNILPVGETLSAVLLCMLPV